MRVLLFTHKVDIDGMGSAVLSKLAFDDVDIIFCETFEVDEKFKEVLKLGKILKYDYVFITDLCLSGDYIQCLKTDNKLSEKGLVFDHHRTSIDDIKNYKNITIKIQDENGLCCGTSLFYDYLLKHNFIKKDLVIDEFVELTRQYDTWEWKHVYHNEKANELNLLFNILGRDAYVLSMIEHIKVDKSFDFNSDEKNSIRKFVQEIQDLCDLYVSKIDIKNIDGYVVGVMRNVEHRCRNDLAEVVVRKNIDVDYIVYDLKDRDTISFRSINPEIDVSTFAINFGGKGHKNASSCPKGEKANKKFFS